MTIDSRAPVASITGAATIVDIEHDEAAFHQQVMKHVFAIVLTPPTVDVLQVTGAMNEDHRGPTALPVGRGIDASIDGRAIAGFETGDRRVDPVVSEKLGNGRDGCCFYLSSFSFTQRLVGQKIQLRRLVAG